MKDNTKLKNKNIKIKHFIYINQNNIFNSNTNSFTILKLTIRHQYPHKGDQLHKHDNPSHFHVSITLSLQKRTKLEQEMCNW